MAYVEKRVRTDRDGRQSTTFKARLRAPDGRLVSKTFDIRADARRWLAIEDAKVVKGEWVDPAHGRRTLEDYAEEWRAVQLQHRPSTVAQVETNLRRHVYPHLGDRTLASVRPSEVQAWVKSLSVDLAPATVELVYRYLVSIFRGAVADGLLTKSPCVGVKLPKVERAQVVPLPVGKVLELVDAVPRRSRALVVTAAGTGLRQGELLGLGVDQIDMLRRTVRVDRQLVLLPGAPPKLGPPKTTASRRTVPLPATVVDALALHLAEFPPGPDGLVFTTDAGEPIRRNRCSEMWAAGVASVKLPKGTRFHELRHFYASLLIGQGASVKVVQARLGHASAMETLDTYGHLWPDDEDRTRQAVDAVLGEARREVAR